MKRCLPQYLRAIGCELSFSNDDKFTTACPIHGGVKKNFHAHRMHDGKWVWTCRSRCSGDGGTTLDLHARLHGLDAKTRQCVAGAAELVRITPDDTGSAPKISADERLRRQLEEERRARKEAESQALTDHLHATLEKRLHPFDPRHHFTDWRDLLHNGSLLTMEGREHDGRLLIESLFHPDDLLWLGEVEDSGKEIHKGNFRPCAEWLEADYLPPRIAAGVFKPGSISRSAENVTKSPFIVIESDNLIGHEPTTDEEREQNKALSFSLFFYCQEILGLHPRAVIDTGNKSLHLWFDRPPPDEFAALLDLAGGLRLDQGLLERCHFSPLRLPGTIHDKTSLPATLHFINPIHPQKA